MHDWAKIIARENNIAVEDVTDPQGIAFVCDSEELVVNGALQRDLGVS